MRRPVGGSRFLYEPFDYGSAKVIEANERVVNLQFEGIDARLNRIEAVMERLEKRLWLTVYGVVGTILTQALNSILTITPNGGP
ncbi:hypothetical protein FPZ52_04235 [Qingshengfaniella alkalisoli]|uniref:Uncharacterized protein n=2 Tax=Qingshengfaniella alkalisoli TaxID=2599296 RepID=A0A5B8IZ80_9RHOB|nr:hypothetical protein FPZ52_04235 [Qingshengfaniella alkalisoli]